MMQKYPNLRIGLFHKIQRCLSQARGYLPGEMTDSVKQINCSDEYKITMALLGPTEGRVEQVLLAAACPANGMN